MSKKKKIFFMSAEETHLIHKEKGIKLVKKVIKFVKKGKPRVIELSQSKIKAGTFKFKSNPKKKEKVSNVYSITQATEITILSRYQIYYRIVKTKEIEATKNKFGHYEINMSQLVKYLKPDD